MFVLKFQLYFQRFLLETPTRSARFYPACFLAEPSGHTTPKPCLAWPMGLAL